ncbi:MAG TPA: hypothetical protein VFA18_07995 [Gemmataceae bacterium]|nr:hypothetical protein [Gemmataceae bacterium]
MFRKLLLTAVASLALLSPLAFTSTASAHDFRHHEPNRDRREVVRHDLRGRRPIVRTVRVVQPVIQVVPAVPPATVCR